MRRLRDPLHRSHIGAVEAALRRLGTDRIDLLQLHAFDASTPTEEAMGTLDRLIAGTRQGDQIVFTWINQDPQEGDRFLWSVVDVSGQVDPQQVGDAVAQLPATPGTVCIDVMLRREDGRVSEPVRGCVDG